MSITYNRPNMASAEIIRPLLNIGALMDYSTGRIVKGLRGENIINGGVAPVEGITAIGNMYKSTLLKFRQIMVYHNYLHSMGAAFDTENSDSLQRWIDLADHIDPSGALGASLDEDVGRFLLTSAEKYSGTEWYMKLKEFAMSRPKAEKKIKTPFPDREGKPIEMLMPYLQAVDSLSMFKADIILKQTEDGNIGDKELNTVDMNAQRARSQFVDDLPNITGRYGFYISMTAHMGEKINMQGPYDPQSPPKLATIKGTKKMKKVPENFTFLTNNLFEITHIRPLINQSTKQIEFPINSEDDMKGNTDLMVATIMPLRTKYGKTGIPFELIISQKWGVQATLSEFWYCKSFDRYGLAGNLVNVELDLYPGVKFTRTTIRQLIASDPAFRRAMQITADLCQMRALWPEYAIENITFTPKELYEKIKLLGYDWDEIYKTRSHWTFDQYENPIKFLSTVDLIEMYHERYKPYWKS